MSFFTDASFVMDPNVYGVGKLYVPKPTDGSGDLTFSRASTGTRVNQDGLIEKVRTNLILQSNTFNTTWATYDTSVTSGQADKDGGTDAWLLAITGATGFQTLRQTISNSGLQTFSIYAKAGTLGWMRINTGVSNTYFNISTGAVGTDSSLGASIEAVGNGYFRCSVPVNGSLTFIFIYPATGDNNPNQSSGNILIQNAQLEQGDVMTDYIPTTTSAVSVGPLANIPRLNYGSDGCPSLLLEPQRTNLGTYSEQFNDSSWAKITMTVSANAALSPDGNQNADKIYPSANGTTFVYKSLGGTGTQTNSFFVKAGGKNFCWLLNASGSVSAFFNLANGTVATNPTGTAKIESFGNGWYRVSETTSSVSGNYLGIGSSDSASNDTSTVNGTDGIFIWGAQNEQGSYATSYIPTLSTSVTRLADQPYKTGISSLIGQTEGTIFVDFIMKNPISSVNRVISLTETNWAAGGSFRIDIQASGIFFEIVNNYTTVGSISVTIPFTQNTRYKIAAVYKENDCVLYVNGAQIGVDTSTGAMPTCSELYLNELGAGFGGPWEASEFNQALLFKTRLSNADLARLTSL